MSDFWLLNRYVLYVLASAFILCMTILIKVFTEQNKIGQEAGRKLLHFFAVMTCAYVVHNSDHNIELAIIFIFFSAILSFIAHYNLLLKNERTSYGIAFFPLAFALLLLLPLSNISIVFAILTLGISDAAAGMIGHYYARDKLVFLYETKSWIGFGTFFTTTCFITYGFLGWQISILMLALIISLSELFSYRGSDNLTVPLLAAFCFEMMSKQPMTKELWLGFFVVLAIFFFTFYKKWLTAAGVTAAILLASLILSIAGLKYLIPMAIFFFVGSATSKLHPKNKDAQGRNAFQVFANGLVATLCLMAAVFSGNEWLYLAFFASVNISFADTLSSDIGLYFRHKTYDIYTFKKLEPGLSGGVSLIGTVAGVLGSMIFALIIMYIFQLGMNEAILITIAGSTGMIVDSLIGSWWQAKYLSNNILTEEKGLGNILIKGKSWLDNDGVNLISNITVTLSLILYSLI